VARPGRSRRLRVCVVGAGGREHALATALAASAEVIVTPGNPGMRALPGGDRLTVTTAPPEGVDADLWVIGPESPLVDGLADRLRAGGRAVFGPGADGARLEGSKAWMKELLEEAGVPTARFGAFDRPAPAIELLRSLPPPWVVKTDGLAAGKGVLVTEFLEEAEADVVSKLSGAAFGAAGRRVVIEEGLVGAELSVMAVCDGKTAVVLAPAQDFKRVGDGDTGPNTGGMGAYSPVPAATPDVVATVMDTAIMPTLSALSERGIDYRGVLYAGLMLTAEGPKVVEFNVRFGDPETQVVLPRLRGDLAAVLAAAAAGRLDEVEPPSVGPNAAVCVVVAAEGYPSSPRTGDRVEGLAEAAALPGVAVYAAGVDAGPAGGIGAGPPGSPTAELRTAGGRVFGVTGTGATLAEARERAYAGAAALRWPGAFYRRDIAARAVHGSAPGPAAPR
jgi:phosphoribosylamine--glycine ligase